MVFPILVLGCSENLVQTLDKGQEPDPAEDDDDSVAEVLTLRGDEVFDPLFGEAVLAVEGAPPGSALQLEILGQGGAPVRVLSGEADGEGRFEARWDGRTDGGQWTEAGLHRVVASTGDQRAETELTAVRAGFVSAWLEDDDGISALREPLYWPIEEELQDEGEPVAGLASIDDGERPLDFVGYVLSGPPLRPDRLSEAWAEPAAYVYDSRPLLGLRVAEASALGETGLQHAEVSLAVEGWTVLEGNPLRPGADVLLQRNEPLGDTVGVSELELMLSFQVAERSLGAQRLPLRLYRVLDVSQFENPREKYRPWGIVLEQALPALEGTPAEVEPVLDALTSFVYYDLGLEYDTQYGASAYTEYLGFDWSRPHFYLTSFLQRSNGHVINCTDAGAILGAYANMVGARLDLLVLDPSFELNYILAIGGTTFTSCPFGAWGCGFSYHAVATHPGSDAIWDATLALDGDDNPGGAPHLEMLVHHVPSEEYLDRLVRQGGPDYHSQSQETLQ